MNLHVLKIKDIYYSEIFKKNKLFELRKDDRGYKVNDLIHFVKVDGTPFANEPNNLYKITFVLKDVKEYGLMDGYVILSIKRIDYENI